MNNCPICNGSFSVDDLKNHEHAVHQLQSTWEDLTDSDYINQLERMSGFQELRAAIQNVIDSVAVVA